MLLGIDVLSADHFKLLNGMKIGLCSNISACNSQLQPTMILFEHQRNFTLDVVFTPEHGLFGALQDQKKSSDFFDKKKNIKIHSLYGKRLAPDITAIKKLDCIVIDLQDIGTRYYTFSWSAVLLIQQCALLKKKIIILDRPNPLNGVTLEGPVLEPRFSSFVGLYPIPVRHGLTLGELCTLISAEFNIPVDITVVKMKLWQRHYYFDDTKLPWTMPSPNMPGLSTALVYPGMCLVEGTNVSEGRGTTRPFETIGAPWIDPFLLVASLKKETVPGVQVRPTFFIPTFNKYKNELCGGLHIYVHNRKKFNSVLTGLTIIKIIKKLYPDKFRWRTPPYEFEKKKFPFDILIGNEWVRRALNRTEPIAEMRKKWMKELMGFKKIRKKYLLYR
jgi:uncharacterized protein YbbC (DUF1343 family)